MPAHGHHGRRSLLNRLIEVLRVFWLLGWTAFGGTTANIVLLRNVFVVKEGWLDDRTFNDLLALGNALPGPAFSQLAFSISALRGGVVPALLSFVLLTAPGSILMISIGFAVRRIPNELPPIVLGLLTGLNAAAVGLVCVAAVQLSRKVLTDNLSRLLLFLSASVAICYTSQWLYPVIVASAGIISLIYDQAVAYRARRAASKTAVETVAVPPPQATLPDVELNLPKVTPPAQETEANVMDETLARNATRTTGGYQEAEDPEEEVEESYFTLSIRGGLCIAAAFFTILIIMLVVRGTTPHKRALDFATNMVLAGTLIFGGGPVVVPLLRGYTVDPGWVTSRDFLIGYALLQALPGPQFNFAGFLGVLILPSQPILGGILGVLAIFLPGIALKLAALPLYQRWKEATRVRSVLRGLNAAAVGLVFSAVYVLFQVGFLQADPEGKEAAVLGPLGADPFWVTVVAGSFLAVDSFDLAPPFAIIGGALAGLAWFGVQTLQTPSAGLQSIVEVGGALVFM